MASPVMRRDSSPRGHMDYTLILHLTHEEALALAEALRASRREPTLRGIAEVLAEVLAAAEQSEARNAPDPALN